MMQLSQSVADDDFGILTQGLFLGQERAAERGFVHLRGDPAGERRAEDRYLSLDVSATQR